MHTYTVAVGRAGAAATGAAERGGAARDVPARASNKASSGAFIGASKHDLQDCTTLRYYVGPGGSNSWFSIEKPRRWARTLIAFRY